MKKLLSLVENRSDLAVIANLIESGSNVLDLGCGNGSLLRYLIDNKGVTGMGIEIDFKRFSSCIEKGIPVVEHDLNESFINMNDKSYYFVILSQTIQEVLYPKTIIEEILRIGKYGILSFPNFGNLSIRAQLMFKGRMPRTNALPFEWYDTPNIHMMTFADFQDFCQKSGIKILKTIFIVGSRIHNKLLFPNLFSDGCIALITK